MMFFVFDEVKEIMAIAAKLGRGLERLSSGMVTVYMSENHSSSAEDNKPTLWLGLFKSGD